MQLAIVISLGMVIWGIFLNMRDAFRDLRVAGYISDISDPHDSENTHTLASLVLESGTFLIS